MKGGRFMDCEKTRELLWDFDDLDDGEKAEILSHLQSCRECSGEFEIIKKVQSTTVAPEISVADKVIERISKEKLRTSPLKALRYTTAACLALVFCAFLLLRTFDKKDAAAENDAALAPEMKAESVFDTADGGDYNFLYSENYSDEETAMGSVTVTTTTQDNLKDFQNVAEDSLAVESEPEAAGKTPPEADEQMKLNYYKDALDISSHTVDLVVSGRDIDKALEVLAPFGAVRVENHVEIEGDFSLEVEKILLENSFNPLYSTSSETPRKTLVFFEDYLD